MCGITAILLKNKTNKVVFKLFDSLIALQSRGQEAAGICTTNNNKFYIKKTVGLIKNLQLKINECKGFIFNLLSVERMD